MFACNNRELITRYKGQQAYLKKPQKLDNSI